jgi:CHAT domain-containing protein
LDLQGTELVVLSACETGLGDRSMSGDLLGLRRAFHVAGAQAVLISMWQVNDPATAALMKSFYQYWLSNNDKYRALLLAARDVKAKYPDPYYWAPFVLFGSD